MKLCPRHGDTMFLRFVNNIPMWVCVIEGCTFVRPCKHGKKISKRSLKK